MTSPEYDRGRLDGEVAAALARHEDHFTRMNGSLDVLNATMAQQAKTLAAELAVLSMAVQRLADLGNAREKTVETTARALKVADDQRRDAGDTKARPINLVIGAVGAVMAVLAVVVAVYVASKR